MNATYVYFDIGNVLMSAHTTWGPAVADAGVLATHPERLADTTFELPEYLQYEAGTISEDAYLEAVTTYLGLTNSEAARSVHEHILNDEFPGVLEIVLALKKAGVPTACLSNNNPIHWKVFVGTDRFPAVREVDFPIASFELGSHKPHAEIYQTFAQRLGWEPEAIVYIEDNVTNAQAAKELGWQSHIVDPTNPMAVQLKAILAPWLV